MPFFSSLRSELQVRAVCCGPPVPVPICMGIVGAADGVALAFDMSGPINLCIARFLSDRLWLSEFVSGLDMMSLPRRSNF